MNFDVALTGMFDLLFMHIYRHAEGHIVNSLIEASIMIWVSFLGRKKNWGFDFY